VRAVELRRVVLRVEEMPQAVRELVRLRREVRFEDGVVGYGKLGRLEMRAQEELLEEREVGLLWRKQPLVRLPEGVVDIKEDWSLDM
jgi:hypothetical protein